MRLDGVKLAVCEVMGLDLDEPKLGAFAGSLNALDFSVQLLVRQHQPVLATLRSTLAEARPDDLPQQTREAAESLGRLLTGLETRDGILDRRFYAVCEYARMDELRGLLARAGLGVFPLNGQALRLLLLASALGGSPTDRDEDEELEIEVNRRDIRVGGHLTRSLHLGKWPRSLAPGFPPGPDGRRSADGPVGSPGGHPVGAGRPHPGVAEGPLRVGPVSVPEPGPEPVAGSGDSPGGREPFAR